MLIRLIMKSTLTILLAITLLLGCKNEAPKPKVVESKTNTSYCELYGMNRPGTDEYTIYVNYGGETHKGETRAGFRSKEHQILTYGGDTTYYVFKNATITALNFMSEEGWEFVQTYTTYESHVESPLIYTCHYILKKSIVVIKE